MSCFLTIILNSWIVMGHQAKDARGGKMEGRSIWKISLALSVILVFVVAQPSVSALIIGATSFGDTEITSNSCDADAWGAVPASLDVGLGDTVWFFFNTTLVDSRQVYSEAATHNYTWILSTRQSVGDVYWYYQTTTRGGVSGWRDMQPYGLYITSLPDYVHLYWHARITSSGCSDFDYKNYGFNLY